MNGISDSKWHNIVTNILAKDILIGLSNGKTNDISNDKANGIANDAVK